MKTLKSNRLFLSFNELTFHKANRNIEGKQVEILKDSVTKHSVLRLVIVVLLKGKYIIVDGQHLTHALYQLGLPIECAIVPCANEKEMVDLMRDLNRIANNWKLEDYIRANKELGNKNYIELSSLLNGSNLISKNSKNKLKIQTCLLFSIYAQKNRSIAKDMIEKGTFEIVDKLKSDALVGKIYDLQRVGLPSNSRKVNEALINLIAGLEFKGMYNHKNFIENIRVARSKGEIVFADNEKEIANQLRGFHDKVKTKNLVTA